MSQYKWPERTVMQYKTDDEIKIALEECHGNMTKAAKMLGFAQLQSFQLRMRKSPELKEFRESCLESFYDVAEDKLFQKVEEGDIKAIEMVLKKSGRGYGDKLEVNLKSMNLNFDINLLERMTVEELEVFNAQRVKLLGQDVTE